MSNKNREYYGRNTPIQKKDSDEKKKIIQRIAENTKRNSELPIFPWMKEIGMHRPTEL